MSSGLDFGMLWWWPHLRCFWSRVFVCFLCLWASEHGVHSVHLFTAHSVCRGRQGEAGGGSRWPLSWATCPLLHPSSSTSNTPVTRFTGWTPDQKDALQNINIATWKQFLWSLLFLSYVCLGILVLKVLELHFPWYFGGCQQVSVYHGCTDNYHWITLILKKT